jgi:hypothetical protein
MKQKRKFSLCLVALFIFSGMSVSHFAQAQLVQCGYDVLNPVTGVPEYVECELKDLVLLAIRFINFLLGLSWLVAIFFVFWRGYSMVTSWGNPQALTEIKAGFRNAIFGFFFIMIAYMLVNFIIFQLGGFSFSDTSSDATNILKFIFP